MHTGAVAMECHYKEVIYPDELKLDVHKTIQRLDPLSQNIVRLMILGYSDTEIADLFDLSWKQYELKLIYIYTIMQVILHPYKE